MSRRARLSWLVATCALAASTSRPARAADWIPLAGPATVQGVLRKDVDGDGVTDLLVVDGRTVWIWKGRKGSLPAQEGTVVRLPDDVSFVDADGAGGLWVLGTKGVRTLLPTAAGAVETEYPAGLAPPLGWRDPEKATFAELAQPDGGLLLPAQDGWRLLRGKGAPPLAVPIEPLRTVTPAGPFLEDTFTLVQAWPVLARGAPLPGSTAGAEPSWWAVSGDRLVAQYGEHRVTYDLSFLPGTGERRIADMDGDGLPDVMHGEGTNRDLKVALFRTRPPAVDARGVPAAEGPGHRPPVSFLHLTGNAIDPRTLDLDADGRGDFVVTTIEIDSRNVARAVMARKVTAQTRAFLQRPGERWFPDQPDASITSDIGVRIRFGFTGSIDVKRSFTIVVDGDFDGDRRKDLLIRTGPGEARLFAGRPTAVWSPEGRPVSLPPMGESTDADGWAADLTGDGKDELVLVYRKPGEGTDRIFVVRP